MGDAAAVVFCLAYFRRQVQFLLRNSMPEFVSPKIPLDGGVYNALGISEADAGKRYVVTIEHDRVAYALWPSSMRKNFYLVSYHDWNKAENELSSPHAFWWVAKTDIRVVSQGNGFCLQIPLPVCGEHSSIYLVESEPVNSWLQATVA